MMSGCKKQCLPCSIPKHIQIDEAHAETVAKITEAATQRETLRAPACRPCKWWIGAHAWSALQRNACHGGAIQKLHVQRMTWLRSIDSSDVRTRDKQGDYSDDAEQSTEHKEPERNVLCTFEQYHTTVEVRARRLAYCPRLLKHAPKGLLALLQPPYKKTVGPSIVESDSP